MKTQPYQPTRAAERDPLFAEEVLLTQEGKSVRLLLPLAMLYVSNSVRVSAAFTLSRLNGTVLAQSDGETLKALPEISAVLPGIQQFFDEFANLLAGEITKELVSSHAASEPEASSTAPSAG